MVESELAKNIYPREHPEDGPRLTKESEAVITGASDDWLINELVKQTRAGEVDDGEQGEQTTALWFVWGIAEELRTRLAHSRHPAGRRHGAVRAGG